MQVPASSLTDNDFPLQFFHFFHNIQKFVGTTVTGWTSTIAVICFVSGVQLICMGVLGEYIGKIYMEVKHRPRYIISERTEDLKEKDK